MSLSKHQSLYCIAGNFRYLAPELEPSAEMCVGSNIRGSVPGNHTHQLALHVKYRCVGVYPGFNFRVHYSALEKREIFAPHEIFALYGTYVRTIKQQCIIIFHSQELSY